MPSKAPDDTIRLQQKNITPSAFSSVLLLSIRKIVQSRACRVTCRLNCGDLTVIYVNNGPFFLKKFSSPALMVWDTKFLEDFDQKDDSINQSIN